MSTQPPTINVETEIVTLVQALDAEQILRTTPHMAGTDLSTDQATEVWVELGRRPVDSDAAFVSSGPFISIAAKCGDQDHTLDYDEEDAVKLVGALALAVGDLRKAREAER